MEQIVLLGIVVTLSIWLSLIYVMRARRAQRRQILLSAAFSRARAARSHGMGGSTGVYDVES